MPPIIDPSIVVEIEGRSVELAVLVDFITYFVTSDDLQKDTVLFPHGEIVFLLRRWIADGGDPPPRLLRYFKSKIHGHGMSSHDVERAVGAGQSTKRQYAHSQHEEKTAGVVGALLNGSRQDLRQAAYDYEALVVNGIVVPSK